LRIEFFRNNNNHQNHFNFKPFSPLPKNTKITKTTSNSNLFHFFKKQNHQNYFKFKLFSPSISILALIHHNNSQNDPEKLITTTSLTKPTNQIQEQKLQKGMKKNLITPASNKKKHFFTYPKTPNSRKH